VEEEWCKEEIDGLNKWEEPEEICPVIALYNKNSLTVLFPDSDWIKGKQTNYTMLFPVKAMVISKYCE
jgi:hypothetical protein